MSDFIKPEAGRDYLLDGERVTVVEALKKRFWRIRISRFVPELGGDNTTTIPEADWRAKAASL
jgi:hypothetical protein